MQFPFVSNGVTSYHTDAGLPFDATYGGNTDITEISKFVQTYEGAFGRDQTQNDIDQYLNYYNAIYRIVKSKSREILKRFVTVTINPGSRSTPYYDRSIYQHSGDITKVCFDQIMCHESYFFPNIDSIVSDTSSTSENRFDRSTRIAVVHSQPSFDKEKVKELSKYWGWMYITSNLMPNPFDDLSKVYFKEMCETFADNTNSKMKLSVEGPGTLGNKVVQVAAGVQPHHVSHGRWHCERRG